MRKRSKVFFVIMMVAVMLFVFSISLFAEEKITLAFMSWEASPLESQSIRKGLEGFMAANPNIEVKHVTSPWAQHHPKLRTTMAAGTAPDVFYMHPDYLRDFVIRGQLLDITDLFNKYYKLEDFIPSSREKMLVKFPGELEPRIFGVDICVVGPVLFYNKDLFDKAGVPYPPTELSKQWTWEQFVEYMQKLTIKEGDKTVQYGTANFEEPMTLYTLAELLLSNGAKWFNDDFTKAIGIDSPETRDTLQKIKDLRVKYGVTPDPGAIGLEVAHSPTKLMLTGRVATLFLGSYALQELSQSNIRLGAGLPPKMEKGTIPIGSAHVTSIWSGTKHPKEAMELLTYLTSMDFGIPIYRSGLWMPNRLFMYEKDNISKWYDPEVYPEGWLNMLFLWKDAKGRWVDKFVNIDKIYDIITEELQSYFYADKSLDEVLPRMQNRINYTLGQ